MTWQQAAARTVFAVFWGVPATAVTVTAYHFFRAVSGKTHNRDLAETGLISVIGISMALMIGMLAWASLNL